MKKFNRSFVFARDETWKGKKFTATARDFDSLNIKLSLYIHQFLREGKFNLCKASIYNLYDRAIGKCFCLSTKGKETIKQPLEIPFKSDLIDFKALWRDKELFDIFCTNKNVQARGEFSWKISIIQCKSLRVKNVKNNRWQKICLKFVYMRIVH